MPDRDVEPNFRTNVGPCEGNQDKCSVEGCPKHGTLGKKGLDGNRRVRLCGDPSARGKRNRSKGDLKARRARKGLRLAGANTRHEEHVGGPARWEAKAGAKAKPVGTAYENSRAQSDAARALGDVRPFVASFAPDNTKHTYYVVRDDDLDAFVMHCADAWFGDGAA